MASCPPQIVPAPPNTPFEYGLFSVAAFPPTPDHVGCGVQYQPPVCGQAYSTHDPCNTDGSGTPGTPTKTVDDGIPIVVADPFVVYAGFSCRLLGLSLEGAQARAEQAILLNEQRAVEATFWTGAEGNDPHLADPSAVVLGLGLSPVAALSALEDFLGHEYYGLGVLHAPRGMGSYWNQYYSSVNGQATTKLGTRIAFGGGYSSSNTGPDGTLAAVGTAWVYATGQPAIWRGDVFFNPDPITQAFNKTTNEIALVAEREYVVGYECVLAAVQVDLTCCSCAP